MRRRIDSHQSSQRFQSALWRVFAIGDISHPSTEMTARNVQTITSTKEDFEEQ